MEEPPLTPFRVILRAYEPIVWTVFNKNFRLAIYEHVLITTTDEILIAVVGYHPGKRFELEKMARYNNAYSKPNNGDRDYLSIALVNTTYPAVTIDLAEPDSIDRLDELWNNPPCTKERSKEWPHAPISRK